MERFLSTAALCGAAVVLFITDMPITQLNRFLPVLLFASLTITNGAEIKWITDKTTGKPLNVVVTQLNELHLTPAADWKSWLKVFVESEDAFDSEVPAILGHYEKSQTEITFHPRFPLSERLIYRAEFNPTSSDNRLKNKLTSFWRPLLEAQVSSTQVANVYPSTDILPENLLKFYIHFSGSMSGGNVYDHIHLYDRHNHEIELPFLELGEELWDASMERLTLFIDPGRIKRGVKPLEEIGPSLQEGANFTLVIDRQWRDAAGLPLKQDYTKKFKVTAPDRESINPHDWILNLPSAGSNLPLVIEFGEALDFALAHRLIQILSMDGHPVEGAKKLENNETSLTFTPNQPWQKGEYTLRIQSILEDLAGNNVGKTFEVDVFNHVHRRIQNDHVDVMLKIH